MNPEVKKIWIEALLSGKYKQGKNSLLHADRYCCLGVLCDLHSKTGQGEWIDDNITKRYRDKQDEWDVASCILPAVVVKWAGVPETGEYGDYQSLASDNDCGKPFKKIAEIIEREF